MFSGQLDALGTPGEAGKHPSIRQLASRADCPLKKTALAQTIAVYAVVRREPELLSLAEITPAHVATVVGLPKMERHAMLLRANHERWSVRVLSRNVRCERRPDADSSTSRARSLRQALAYYRNGLKGAQEALRILKRQDALDPSLGSEVATLIRALVQLLGEAGEVVRTTRRVPDRRPGTRDRAPCMLIAGMA